MKIAFVSDTHGFEGSLDIPECDVLVHAGDVCSGFGELMSIQNIAYWFEQLKSKGTVKEIILVPGNHDTNFLSKPEMSKALLKRGCHFLQNEEVEIDGVKFYGTMFLDIVRNDSFLNLEDVIDGRIEFYDNMPECDVLITHQPPDIPHMSTTVDGFNLGCPFLKIAVEKLAPKIHSFGHVHNGAGQQQIGPTLFINAANGYENHPIPIVEI